MSKQSEEMLADLSAAIQRVAEESSSGIVHNLVMVEELNPETKGDLVVMGVVDLWAGFRVAGIEVNMKTRPDRNLLHKLVKVRIQDTLFAIRELANSELKKLGSDI